MSILSKMPEKSDGLVIASPVIDSGRYWMDLEKRTNLSIFGIAGGKGTAVERPQRLSDTIDSKSWVFDP